MRTARLVLPVLVFAALGGCNREPSFDQRFEEANSSISASAAAIDAEIRAAEQPVPAQKR